MYVSELSRKGCPSIENGRAALPTIFCPVPWTKRVSHIHAHKYIYIYIYIEREREREKEREAVFSVLQMTKAICKGVCV